MRWNWHSLTGSLPPHRRRTTCSPIYTYASHVQVRKRGGHHGPRMLLDFHGVLTLTTIQAARLFAAMLDDIVMDATLQSHHEIARGRVSCQICRTRSAHFIIMSQSSYPLSCCTGGICYTRLSNLVNRRILKSFCTVHGSNGHALPQDAGSVEVPSSSSKTLPNTGTSTPTTVKDGNILFECTMCKRQVRLFLLRCALALIPFAASRLLQIDMHLISVHAWV